jgi:hypothetical protein
MKSWKRNLSEWLVLLAVFLFFTAAQVKAEEYIAKPFEMDSVYITFFWFDTLQEMRKWVATNIEDEKYDPELMGFSLCEHYEEHGAAHCDLYVVRPKIVDDEATLTIGHEVLHGVYEHYHGMELSFD